MYRNDRLEEFLEKTKTKDMPGGGSVVGYTGALGAALTLMVANLSYGKKRFEEKGPEVKAAVKADYAVLEALIEDMTAQMKKDATSFDGVLEAMKMPKENEEQKAARRAAIQKGYIIATQTPLETAEIMVRAMEAQQSLAKHGDIYAITDQGAGTLLLAASAEAALLNVIVNLKSMDDSPAREDIVRRFEQCRQDIERLRAVLMGSCYQRLEEMK